MDIMNIEQRLLKMPLEQLQEKLKECSDSFVRTVALREAIRVKKAQIKHKKDRKKIKKINKIKNSEKNSDKNSDKYLEELRAEDFLDNILFDEKVQDEEYDPILMQEVRRDSINHRVMDRMSSELVIKNNNNRKKKMIPPYVNPVEYNSDTDSEEISDNKFM